MMSDQSPDYVVFTVGGKKWPVPLISFVDAKRRNIITPPAFLAHIEHVFTVLAALLHTEEKPMSAAFLMEAASLGEALDLPNRWAQYLAGVPSAPPQAPPLPGMPSLSVAVPEQTAGLGPNFPDVNPPAAG